MTLQEQIDDEEANIINSKSRIATSRVNIEALEKELEFNSVEHKIKQIFTERLYNFPPKITANYCESADYFIEFDFNNRTKNNGDDIVPAHELLEIYHLGYLVSHIGKDYIYLTNSKEPQFGY